MNYLTVFPKQVRLDTSGKHTIFNLLLSVSDQTQRIQQLPQQEKSGFCCCSATPPLWLLPQSLNHPKKTKWSYIHYGESRNGNINKSIQLVPTTYTCLHPLSSHILLKTKLNVERQCTLTVIYEMLHTTSCIRDRHSVALQPGFEPPPANSTSGLICPAQYLSKVKDGSFINHQCCNFLLSLSTSGTCSKGTS